MCGITLTSISNKINLSTRVKPSDIIFMIKKLIKTNNEKYIDQLFDLTTKYKSDLNFIYYFKSSNERKQIFICNQLLKKFLKKNKINFTQKIKKILPLKKKLLNSNKILDIMWFLDNELQKRYKFVKNFIDEKNFNNHTIVFFKVLNTVINSINLLEIRGRDSLGLMLNINLKKNDKNIFWLKNNIGLKKNYIKIKNDNIVVNPIYKSCNIFGSLGQNSDLILKQIKNDHLIINLLKSGNFENINIVAHTRWASVGEVSLENTHPLVNLYKVSNKLPTIFSVMNGDIYDYERIIYKNKKIKNIKYNKNLKSDALALSYLFSDSCSLKNEKEVKKKLKSVEGSFVGAVISDEDISKILFIKKGGLGLYYGKNYDRSIFSSDIYGLVEECVYFYEFKKNTFSLFNTLKNKTSLKVNELISKKNNIVDKKNLKKIAITTRDVSKKDFSYFLEKEINEAPEIINKTILNYINIKNVLLNNNNFFIEKEFSKLKPIIKKIKNGKINKIIITGMGTCHTAAEAIADHMRKNFNSVLPKISVSAVIASEASAFHIENNMKKTFVIAIAQSGTTKDTNTFIDIAKKNGAHTAAILNKRNGDISYIVDNTLYLGNGRDIEIAVPSTKTYLCHVILGYIFTLNIISKISSNSKKIRLELKEILKVSKNISLILKKNKIKNINGVYKRFANNKNWYCLYDDRSKKYASMEIRIKLSECCYKTLTYMNIKNFIKNKINNSIIVYDVGLENHELEHAIKRLIEKKNYIVLIGDEKRLKNIKKENKYIYKISYPSTLSDFSIIYSVLIGQILSFGVAKFLDKRGDFFKSITKDLLKKKQSHNIRRFLSKKYEQSFLINYPKNEILILKKSIKNFFSGKNKNTSNAFKYLNYFEQYSRRPIDTIKHQAKTITVGTERKKTPNSYSIKYNKIINTKFINERNNFQKFNFENNSIKNFISEIKQKLKFNNNLKFIGGDANFVAARHLANKVSKSLNISCAFDTLENHKHIDMSAEPQLIVLIANILNQSYLTDAYAEIDKFISHNNTPFIVTNSIDKKYLKKIKSSQIIQVPYVNKKVSLIFYSKLFENLYK